MSILLFDQIDRLFGSFACNLARRSPRFSLRELPVDIAPPAFIQQDFAMTDRFALRQPDDQLLGEMQTEIATLDNDAARILPFIRPGERVYFEPGPVEPESAGARRIRVENGDGELLGHLPHDPADWLWPLLAADKIRLEGYVPVATSPGGDDDSRRLAIVLTVYETEGGRSSAFA